ncbi:hypothetical protein MYA_3214 [Burkholderia sp. KJ006]|nr:hypothetical protein MYA_3214 [Burkholderia sp. KJ006]
MTHRRSHRRVTDAFSAVATTNETASRRASCRPNDRAAKEVDRSSRTPATD